VVDGDPRATGMFRSFCCGFDRRDERRPSIWSGPVWLVVVDADAHERAVCRARERKQDGGSLELVSEAEARSTELQRQGEPSGEPDSEALIRSRINGATLARVAPVRQRLVAPTVLEGLLVFPAPS
jgi:hypothetical protein